jgi:hypothetical protein
VVSSAWDSYLSETVRGPALCSAGKRYPSVQTALDCLDWIESQGLLIVGFDGLNVVAQGIQPSLDHIADFSSIGGLWDARVAVSVAASRDLLTKWLGEIQFVDLTIIEPDDDLT